MHLINICINGVIQIMLCWCTVWRNAGNKVAGHECNVPGLGIHLHDHAGSKRFALPHGALQPIRGHLESRVAVFLLDRVQKGAHGCPVRGGQGEKAAKTAHIFQGVSGKFHGAVCGVGVLRRLHKAVEIEIYGHIASLSRYAVKCSAWACAGPILPSGQFRP